MERRHGTTLQAAEQASLVLCGGVAQCARPTGASAGLCLPASASLRPNSLLAFPIRTPDQLAAIEATFADMERPTPMDRLICGDVGFGKTEVAIRAILKAVLAGKQVALLAPTTVLASNTLKPP